MRAAISLSKGSSQPSTNPRLLQWQVASLATEPPGMHCGNRTTGSRHVWPSHSLSKFVLCKASRMSSASKPQSTPLSVDNLPPTTKWPPLGSEWYCPLSDYSVFLTRWQPQLLSQSTCHLSSSKAPAPAPLLSNILQTPSNPLCIHVITSSTDLTSSSTWSLSSVVLCRCLLFWVKWKKSAVRCILSDALSEESISFLPLSHRGRPFLGARASTTFLCACPSHLPWWLPPLPFRKDPETYWDHLPLANQIFFLPYSLFIMFTLWFRARISWQLTVFLARPLQRKTFIDFPESNLCSMSFSLFKALVFLTLWDRELIGSLQTGQLVITELQGIQLCP